MARWLLSLALAIAGSAAAAPACDPSQIGGTGTRLHVRADANGVAYGWGCPNPYTPATIVLVGGLRSAFNPNWPEIAATLAAGTFADRASAWAKWVVQPWPKDAGGAVIVPDGLITLVLPVWNAVKIDLPPPPVWKVAPNPGFPTRPAYAYSGGIRATTPTARATVGVACYCDTRDVVGATTFCAVNTARTWMSACAKQ